MVNRVRISTIGARPMRIDPGTEQAAVDRMIAYWREQLDGVLCDRPDLIVLPEACDRYPAQSLEDRLSYYRTRGPQVLDFMRGIAHEHGCHIAYSAARQVPDGTWRNSTQIIGREGRVLGIYNKNHPVISETTEAGILVGSSAPIIDCDFGRVACAICFDLNFDELRVQYVSARPDLIVFSSMYHGGLMQSYWAYSCRAHMVTAVAGLPSAIISPVGETIASSTNYYPYVSASINLDCEVVHLDGNWEKLTALRQAYGPHVTVHDPGYLGAVLITSESDQATAREMVDAFEIERLDDYFERSRAHFGRPEHRVPM